MKGFSRPQIALALAGLGLGLLVADLPMNNSWEMSAIYYSIEDPLLSYLKPKVDMETLVVIFRPFWIFIINGINSLFGMNFFVYHLAKALILAAFGPAVYGFLREVAPDRPRVAFAASAMCLLAAPTLTSIWMISQEDVLTTAVFLWSLTLFFRLGQKKASEPGAWRLFAGFALVAFLSFFIKETSRAFSLIVFASYAAMRFGSGRRVNVLQGAGVALAAVLTVVAGLPSRMAPEIPWNKLDPTPEHLRFLLTNGVTQLHLIFFFGGTALLAWGFAARWKTGPRAAVGAALAAVLFTMPVFESYNYFGFVIFDRMPAQFLILTFLFAGALVAGIFRSDFPSNFFSLALTLIVAAVVYATTWLDFVREDVSTRTYLPAAPMLAFLVAEAAGRLYRALREPSAFNRIAQVCFGLFAAIMGWHLAAGGFNALVEFRAHSKAEYASKSRLAAMSLPQTALLHMNDAYPTGRYDLLLLGAAATQFADTDFDLIEPFKKDDNMTRLNNEVCLKSMSLIKRLSLVEAWGASKLVFMLDQPEDYDHNRKAIIHVLEEKAQVPDRLREEMMGDFAWAGEYSAVALTRGVPLSPKKYWDHGLPEIQQRWRFEKETLLDRFLARHGSREYDYAHSYVQLSGLLEQVPALLSKGRPLAVRYVKKAEIWSVDLDKLNCPCKKPACVERYRD